MNTFQKQNLTNIQNIFEQKTGVGLRKPLQYRRPARFSVLAAAVLAFCLLAAFTYPLFSPLAGDALSMRATYEGNGVISIQVENRSQKTLKFQPQLKLVQWFTEEEVEPLPGDVIFTGQTIDPDSTATMTVDLSGAYDMALLEQSQTTQWYYLVLTNQDFLYGQEWKCSVYFGQQKAEDSSPDAAISVDSMDMEKIEEELRFYFEDDYIGVFAANPLHYEYLQKVQELLLRSGKRIIPAVNPMLMAEPIPDGVVLDDIFPLEKQYSLAGQNATVQDAFGKFVGTNETEYAKVINAFLPAYEGAQDQAWTIPLFYFMTFETAAIKSSEDCAFIHGRIVSFGELEPYKVYEDEHFVSYNVTHLFYTDLSTYVADILTRMEASHDNNYYFDQQVYERIENIYSYYQENLSVVSWEEFTEIRPHCIITDLPTEEELVENGLRGVIKSDRDMEKIVITVTTAEGVGVYACEIVPADPNLYSLADVAEASSIIRSLEEGVYVLDVSVWVDSSVMGYSSLYSQIFTTGNAVWPIA